MEPTRRFSLVDSPEGVFRSLETLPLKTILDIAQDIPRHAAEEEPPGPSIAISGKSSGTYPSRYRAPPTPIEGLPLQETASLSLGLRQTLMAWTHPRRVGRIPARRGDP
ncbi:MAG: hypothetical protein CO149_01270 [Nitrospirae bacterium CG_4_9_14_3_um_filter_51_5]|nr:MAG: hypothetical protein CO149_01270 [Nitrospirae bacterium CG_4_9_14_3_um_filter_51_5]